MRKLFVFILGLLFLSCSQDMQNDTITACGCEQPQKNLPWLKELIEKAKTDTTGHYLGTIWLWKYKGRDLFVTNMMLGSGGVLYWVFDCSGNHYRIGDICTADDYVGDHHFLLEEDFPPLSDIKLDVVIYSPF